MQATIRSDDDGHYMASIKTEYLTDSKTFVHLKRAASWLVRMHDEAEQRRVEQSFKQAMEDSMGAEWARALTSSEMVKAYPTFFSHTRNLQRWWNARDKNGLAEAGCVTRDLRGKLLWLPDKTVAWYLNLKG